MLLYNFDIDIIVQGGIYMKIKNLVCTLAAMALLCNSGTAVVMAEDNADTAAAAATEAAETVEPVTADDIKGTWSGTYTGHKNGTAIEREISLNIDECDADGKFSGVATITSSENQSYYFSGTCDLTTGEIRFKGDEWIKNADNWSFLDFKGNLVSGNITGITDNKKDRPFSLEKKSDSFVRYSVDPAALKREWFGEYDGTDGSVVVRRNIKFSITDISDDGKITGSAVFSPSNKAEAKYALDGSYYFTGTLDERYGRLRIKGNEWIEHPAMENFSFIEFIGSVQGDIIEGTTKNGIWKMEATSILKGDLNIDNKLGVEDLVILEKYLLNDGMPFNKTLFFYADMNSDDSVDVFDLIELRKAVIRFIE